MNVVTVRLTNNREIPSSPVLGGSIIIAITISPDGRR